MTWAWHPPHCPNYALDQYLDKGPFTFYTNPYTRVPLKEQEWTDVLDNRIPVYGDRGEHLTHCVYTLLSVAMIFRDGGRYTPLQGEYKHLEHCAGVLIEAVGNDTHWGRIETFVGSVGYDQDC
jgi:hypothetical protein